MVMYLCCTRDEHLFQLKKCFFKDMLDIGYQKYLNTNNINNKKYI